MNNEEKKLDRLIEILCCERGEKIPSLPSEKKFDFFRALVNIRMPKATSDEFLTLQDEYLQSELKRKSLTDINDLTPIYDGIYLWKGDITTLKCDGIVNAANSQMLGCFNPNHHCIDNAIHTFAGVELRQECARIMKAQGKKEETGKAKITSAYNLPCKYILHTVGPVVFGKATEAHQQKLADCYRSCLKLADENGLQSIAFCCISTGAFHFPKDLAAKIAIQTVFEYKYETKSKIKVVFNVFEELDYEIYARLLEI